MTMNERLRALLDERGVEWGASDTYRLLVTSWSDASGHSWSFMEHRDGSFSKLTAYHLTPEQAVAATLGSCNCSNSERTNETCLPHFWTHDGTLHVELPKLPESISVRLPDQRDREVGSARVWQYTRDSGTCHECAGMDNVFECSACGGRYEGWALKRWARYCPDCGRKVVTDG